MKKGKKIISAALAIALTICTLSTGAIQVRAAGAKTILPVIVKHTPTKKVDKNCYLDVVTGDIPTLDTNKNTDQNSARVLCQTMECLTRQEIAKNGAIVNGPGAAEKYTVSPDGLTWTFYLRKMLWSDGKQVTAKDFEYSWLRLLNPKVGCSYAYFIYYVKGAEEYNTGKGSAANVGVKALSQTKFQVVLKKPVAYFDKVLSFANLGPVRADIVNKLGDRYGTQSAVKQMVWCGPFKVDQWVLGQKLVMVKNPRYWDAKKVQLSKLTYELQDYELATQIQLFENHKLDRTGASGQWIDKLKDEVKAGKFRYYTNTHQNCIYMEYNLAKAPIFKNVKVRKAFALAIDRDAYTKVLFKRHISRYSLIPPQMMAGSVEFRKISKEWDKMLQKENPDPKKLLTQGLKELKMSTDPSKLDLEFLSYGSDSLTKASVELTQAQFKKVLGVNVKIRMVADFGQWLKEREEKNYQIMFDNWGADYNDPMTFLDMWTTDSSNNVSYYSNKTYDKLILAAQKELNEKKRNEMLVKAEKIICYDDCICVPIYTQDTRSFFQNYVQYEGDFPYGSDFDFKYAYTSGRN